MEIIDGPRIVSGAEIPYLGIRSITPFRGMLVVRDQLLDEPFGWPAEHAITGHGTALFRLHVIDVEGPMDLEVGVIAAIRRRVIDSAAATRNTSPIPVPSG